MKRCSTCQQRKRISEFNKDRSSKDSRQYSCRTCQNAANKKNRESHAASQRRYIERRPETEIAHALARANKNKLMKNACECCGSTKQLHMHHPDYAKPLEVVTLCKSCHKYTHMLITAFNETIARLTAHS